MLSQRLSVLLTLLLLSLLGAFGLLTLLDTLPVLAAPDATITVNILLDEDDDCASGTGCSLREAIAEAAPDDMIDFGISGTIDISGNGELVISKSLTISSSLPITVSGGDATRIFNVTAGNVTLNGLTIADGNVQSTDCGGNPFQCGGGIIIQNTSVTVTLANSTLSNNTAANLGGGIYNFGGTLTVNNSSLINNSAGSDGGGIYNDAGTMTVTNSSMSNNSAFLGGGIFNDEGAVTVINSDLVNNSVTFSGGGIYNQFGSMTVTDSTLTDNNAAFEGGGVNNAVNGTMTINNSTFSGNSSRHGGGISNFSTMTVTNSTLSGNSANSGGGIRNWGTLTVNNSTVTGNSALIFAGGIVNRDGTFHLSNTIVANTPDGQNDCYSNNMPATNLFNLIEVNNGCATPSSSDDPQLSPLGDYGGATWTHALLLGSPAIEGGQNISCMDTDQRGVSRPQGTTCDIGAFEANSDLIALMVSVVGDGSVTSDPIGIDCGADCSHNFNYGIAVTLTATPDPGFAFSGWSGDCEGTDECIVTMLTARSVTATFTVDTPELTVSVVGDGSVTSDPVGIDCGVDCSEDFDLGTVVTLTATPDIGFTFTGWSGDCDGADCIVTMSAPQNVTATFTLDTHELTVSVAGDGSVTSDPVGIDCGVDCSEDFDLDTVVTLTATPDTGFTFTGWSGDCDGADCIVTMSAPQNVTATFTLDTHELTVSVAGDGTVTSDPVGIDCGVDCSEDFDVGTVVTLTAVADANSTFTSWSGACSGDNDCVVTMTETRMVTATFTADEYLIYLPTIFKP